MDSWQDIPNHEKYNNLLLGNGFSINITQQFAYKTLLQKARLFTESGLINIYPDTFRIFDELNTVSFEEIMKVLHHAHIVHSFNRPAIDTSYRKLQEGLFETVRQIHPQREHIPTDLIFSELIKYSHVFTTNYDLIPYWSFLDNDLGRMRDFFWNVGYDVSRSYFDKHNTEIFAGHYTRMYYLHGALHLEVTEAGDVRKRSVSGILNEDITQLINTFSANRGLYPLFITEGTTDKKARKIGSNDYLAFCFSQLGKITGGLLIFGQSLAKEYDLHLIEKIKKAPNITPIAISVYPHQSEGAIREFEASISHQLEGKDIYFFDSTTHPLGLGLGN